MLDVHPRLNYHDATLTPCVAPKEIFADYDRVVARLTGETVRTSIHTKNDESGYQETPHAREVATNIANTYSGLVVRKGGSTSKSRKRKPYDRTSRTMVSTKEGHSPMQSPDAIPECCRKSNIKDRHWRTCHVFKEAKSILEGRLAIGEGTSILTMEQLNEITSKIKCPHCGALITRSDSMNRHIRQNCKMFEAASMKKKD